MLKPGKTFKISKQTKRFMCTFVDPVARNAFKHAMIQAELAAGIVIKSAPRDKNAPRGGSYTTTSNSATPSAE
jgi:hypothetical protein